MLQVLAKSSHDSVCAAVSDDVGSKAPAGPISCEASSPFKSVEAPAGLTRLSGGSVLALKLIQLLGKPTLVMMATISAAFSG
jgi:hypothetical protein